MALVMRPLQPVANSRQGSRFPEMTAAIASGNLGSLVFDFEAERDEPCSLRSDRPAPAPPARTREQIAADKERLTYFSAPAGTFAGKLLRDVRYFLNEEYDPDAILLATKLSAVGYSVTVRTALGGGTACFRNLRHEFLTVRGRGDYAGVEFIVEPRFREHFTIPHPTPEYAELLAAAPDVFVGTTARLVPMVQTLCGLMALSFETQGLTLPPWRRTQSMLSKWLPNRCRDTSIGSGDGGGGGGLGGSPLPSHHAVAPSTSPFARASAPPHQDPERRQPPSHMPPPPPPPAAAVPGMAAGGAGAAVAPDPSFLRISDPLSLQPHLPAAAAAAATAMAAPSCGVATATPCAAAATTAGGNGCAGSPFARTSDVRREDSGYGCGGLDLPGGFIPFGGAGGCSSDTEGPSPPAPGVMGNGARHGHGFYEPPRAYQLPCALGATPATRHVRRAMGPSSLLAARLQQQLNGHGGGGGSRWAAAAATAPAAAAAIQTRPPAHWGEAPIHTVRMGFAVEPPTAAAPVAVAARAGGDDDGSRPRAAAASPSMSEEVVVGSLTDSVLPATVLPERPVAAAATVLDGAVNAMWLQL